MWTSNANIVVNNVIYLAFFFLARASQQGFLKNENVPLDRPSWKKVRNKKKIGSQRF
jgi:hypothetical protein